MRRAKDRSLGRRRRRNFREPTVNRVEKSVSQIVTVARRYSASDHGFSFASKKENDRLAQVYLERALNQLADEVDG